MNDIIFEDRYTALGLPHPDDNSCDECEGTGYIPCQATNLNEYACHSPKGRVVVVGQKEKDGTPMPDDGWLFVRCPVCKGSRKVRNKPMTNPMTPTEQDNELREWLDRLITENRGVDGSIDISDQEAMRDEILELITANYTPNSEVKKLQEESYRKGLLMVEYMN